MGRMGRSGQCSYAQSYVACTSYSELNVFKITHMLFEINILVKKLITTTISV